MFIILIKKVPPYVIIIMTHIYFLSLKYTMQRVATTNTRFSVVHSPYMKTSKLRGSLTIQHGASSVYELERQPSHMQGSSEDNYQLRK